MEIGITELRAHLSDWLALARGGQQVIVTDRGVPIARLTGLDTTTTIERLTRQGVIARPELPRRPKAGGRSRPRARRPVAGHISDQRR